MAIYATLLYLLCTLLFPEHMGGYSGFEDYFYSRRPWIFGLMALLFVVDVGDTLIKGLPYFQLLGPVYDIRTGVLLTLSLAAIKIGNHRFHAVFAIVALICETAFIVAAHFRM